MHEYLTLNESLLDFLTESKRLPVKFRCGRKVGQRLSDAALIWSETWIEVKL